MISRLLIAFVAVCGVTNAHAQAKPDAPGADLIAHNAKIFTGNPAQPEASALAVKNGRIYSVGADAEVLGLKNANTRVIDSRGRRLIPGIIDAHIHVLNESGYNYNVRWDAVPESQIKSIASVLTVMDGRVVFGAQDYTALSPALPAILPVWSPVKYFGGYYGTK